MQESFYKGKKVLVTGHTGFKGTWLCKMLLAQGADVVGYALQPPTNPNLFSIVGMEKQMQSIIGDIRDFVLLQDTFRIYQPEIVFHLAAQPLVRESYVTPRDTYEINVMGSVNVLECIRQTDSVKSFLNVTTDKVYKNKEWEWGYREYEELDGHDPYSNSKSCSELVTHSYKSSFFDNADRKVALSTVRAGNVIGGGDFADNRIIPDCLRAIENESDIIIRNPYSVRPYQHVLEALHAYLIIAQQQYEQLDKAGWYNIGPDEKDCISTGKLVRMFCEKWNEKTGKRAAWRVTEADGPHEAKLLKLDCSKAKSVFGWHPTWDVAAAVEKIIEWYGYYSSGKDVNEIMDKQIRKFYCDFIERKEYV